MQFDLGLKNFLYKLRMSVGIAGCADYGKLIQLVVDNEATSTEEKYLYKHLKMCVKCLGIFEVDQELKKAVKLRMENKKVPAGLAEIIKSKIHHSA